jgi:hypothetical protein
VTTGVVAARPGARIAEAFEHRTRLEPTERAQGTVEGKRRRLVADLGRERERADRAEERPRRVRGLPDASQWRRDGRGAISQEEAGNMAADGGGGPEPGSGRRSWWHSFFGTGT